MKNRIQLALLLVLSVLLLNSCSKEESYGSISDYISDKSLVGFTATPEGIYIKMEAEGSQAKPNIGSNVTVHYKGSLTNGDVFDSSYDRGAPSTFSLGGVIRGWQIGIPKFGKGGKGTLIIPPSYGYGETGQGSIPKNAILIFDIELIGFQ